MSLSISRIAVVISAAAVRTRRLRRVNVRQDVNFLFAVFLKKVNQEVLRDLTDCRDIENFQ
jgi:hypothetical protein